jgi:hypothetical protein
MLIELSNRMYVLIQDYDELSYWDDELVRMDRVLLW